MQRPPQGGEGLPGLDVYEHMVDTFATNAKAFWRPYGPAGEPMVRGIEAWAEMQRAYIQWWREASAGGTQR